MNFLDFQTWFETISIEDAEKIGKYQQKKLKKSRRFRRLREFKPGTFGVEIEFYPHEPRLDYEATVNKIHDSAKAEHEFDKLAKKYWEPIEPDDWLDSNPMPEEPDELDYDLDDDNDSDNYDRAHRKWQDELEDWEKEYQDIQYEWDHWISEEKSRRFRNFVDEIIEKEEYRFYNVEPEYEKFEDAGYERLDDVISYLQDATERGIVNGETEKFDYSKWIVHVDDSLVEVTSPVLTTDDKEELISVLDALSHEEFGHNTSAHVHVGVPEDTDSFDLLAMTTLPNELDIRKADPNRDTHFTKSSKEMHFKVYNAFNSGEYDEKLFKIKLKNALEAKYWGVNIHGDLVDVRKGGARTVEFRYLSSQIVNNPERFFKFVEYYLKFPQVARGRQQIKLNVELPPDKMGTIYFTRLPGGKIKVDKDPISRVPMMPTSPEELRKPSKKSDREQKMDDYIWSKLKYMGVWDLPKWGIPINQFLYPIKQALEVKAGSSQTPKWTEKLFKVDDVLQAAKQYDIRLKNLEYMSANALNPNETIKDIISPMLIQGYKLIMQQGINPSSMILPAPRVVLPVSNYKRI